MNLARSADGELLEPTRDVSGFCPLCCARLIPRIGRHRYPHWAHKPGAECDTWAEESAWHYNWKNEVEKKFQEIPIEKDGIKHIADIRLPTGIIIEFQKRALDPNEWEAREIFYGKMMWVIYFPKDRLLESNIREIYLPTLGDSLIEVKGLSKRFLDSFHRFPIFLDFTDGDMFRVTEFQNSFGIKSRLYGRFLTKTEFFEDYLRNPFFFDVDHLKITTYHEEIKKKQSELWTARNELESLKKQLLDEINWKKSIERDNRARKKYDEYCRYRSILMVKRKLLEQELSRGLSRLDEDDGIAKLDNELKDYPLRESDDDLFWYE